MIIVSTTSDFDQGGVRCGQISDHTQEPEVSQCAGAAVGRYVTVDLAAGGGGTSGGAYLTICEIEIYGAPVEDGTDLVWEEQDLTALLRALPAQIVNNTCHDGVGRPTSALYEFNAADDRGGRIRDSSGANHGTLHGDVASVPDRFGLSNSAYHFPGDAESYIELGTPFASGNEDYSIAIWIKPNAVDDAGWHGFVGYQDGTRSPSMWQNKVTDITDPHGTGMHWDTRTTQHGDSTRYSGVVPEIFEADRYVHVVWAAQAGLQNYFYKNGEPAPDGTAAAAAHVDLHDSYWLGKVDNFFIGTIDEVAFFDFMLSAREVNVMYSATCPNGSPHCRRDPDNPDQYDHSNEGLDNYAVRTCGAVSQSSIGWGGEPARAIDGDQDTEWSQGSCSHTADIDGPSWFQVDLGAISQINHVDIFHRTDCCVDRLRTDTIMVSDTPDFSQGVQCGDLSNPDHEPEVSRCGGAAEGRYVTVSLQQGNGDRGARALMTICEIEVYGSCWRPGCPALYASTDVAENGHEHHTLNQHQTVRACEHEDMHLSCSSGTIDVIGASYGRQHDSSVCSHPATSDQDCHEPNSLALVREICQGLQDCTVSATNEVFGDPCGGTYKYLTVNYQCV
eukprot:SAG31_NODE_1374_length_8594_cov_57.759623_2_plen_617_part_00